MTVQQTPERAQREDGAMSLFKMRRHLLQGDVRPFVDQGQEFVGIDFDPLRTAVTAQAAGARCARAVESDPST